MRYKLNQTLQDEDYNTGLVQLLHDAARVFELSIKEKSASKMSWFSTAWLGVDKNGWAKALSYQVSVYSLLQAASEISSRGDGRDRDINVFVQRSLSRQSAPMESVIKEKLLAKQPEAYDWFWSEQIPALVTSFINYFEEEQRFAPATAVYSKGRSSVSGNSSDISLLTLALSCIAAITKLGPTKVSSAQFFSIIPDITGRLMDMLVEFVPVRQAYNSIKEIGLHREFLVHFGPRAAMCRMKDELGAEEIMFWVDLVQKQLQRAIDRERIWSRLTTSESIEVLERDLAIFGFFIALGRSTQLFLFDNGFETVDEPIEGFIRYLIGGSVLYYPQLSAISSYQLYVEVVCEELDWLPFYPGSSSTSKRVRGHKHKEGPPNTEAIPVVLDVCSHWIESFIKYSKWLENLSNVKAARFLSKGHNKLKACMEELGMQKDHSPVDKDSQSFDKAFESVEEALLRLEELLQELHVSSSNSGKEHLKAACSDLERIRRLKKEAEFLEASFRAKAASFQQEDISGSTTAISEQPQYPRGKDSKTSDVKMDRSNSSRGLWSFLVRQPAKSSDMSFPTANDSNNGVEQETASKEIADPESNEIQRFELLRNELIELEKRVKKSADRGEYEEEIQVKHDASIYGNDAKLSGLLQVQKKDSIIDKSLDKLKETSTNVLQGTQLLAIDTAAALGLLRRVLIGDELTEKEKQALRRTLTDLASVIPIGFLMLLPVTAVGHAAMLAAIQRYVPSLIPSTYGPERLDLLRQLEKVKEMEDEVNLNENAEE
ncbi:Ca2+-binding transmembrane protein LETM1/MRS7 [Handroanthus impetiginosus]|uniref:Ca2+-binding transmembrane protein LETM1/MRS7 n=1 Tax=Handroanthus impetiginosus TaxID=429701 RepID=A0A2G9HGJ7_9LAMI|nr:Ca2+-binding transmembrane protein LETM1/MRS7 [Handroanthus impetiginosus]